MEKDIPGELHPDTDDAADPGTDGEAPPATREDALAALTAKVGSFRTEDQGRKLWRDVAAAGTARDVSRDDAKRLQDLITARIGELRKTASTYGLDPDDDWLIKIRSVTSPDDADAATADVAAGLKNGHILPGRAEIITMAIDARMAELAGKAAA